MAISRVYIIEYAIYAISSAEYAPCGAILVEWELR